LVLGLLPTAEQCKEKEEQNYERGKREKQRRKIKFRLPLCGTGS
jgi:hypothetical protein